MSHLLKNRHTLLVLLACALFYGAQAMAQWHSIDHLFHASGEDCALYHGIQHHKSAAVEHSVHIRACGSFDWTTPQAYSSPLTIRVTGHYSRAPPLMLPV